MLVHPDSDFDQHDALAQGFAPRVAVLEPIERNGYQAGRASRLFGSVGTVAIGALLAAGLLVALDHVERPKPIVIEPALTVLAVAAAPKPPEPAKAEKPKPVTQPVVALAPPTPAPVHPTVVPLPATPQPVAVATQAASVAPPQAPTTPAPPRPAPAAAAAQPQASHGPDKWEGRVLARIERFRRYPSDAQHAHVEGTTTLRFRIDRDGHVLSSSIEKSSGSTVLDAAALDTLRHADPLPKVPADRPDQVELVVPVEFSLKN